MGNGKYAADKGKLNVGTVTVGPVGGCLLPPPYVRVSSLVRPRGAPVALG